MRDKTILVSLLLFGVLAGFYFMVLSPKREKASELGDEVATLRSDIEAQKQFVSTAEQTRREFPEYYGRLVVLGKAVPEQADTSSMLVQLSQISNRSNVDFQGLSLSQSSGGAAGAAPAAPAPAAPGAAPPAGTSTTPSEGAAPSGGSTPESGSAPPAGGTTPAPASPAPAAGGATTTPAAATAATPAPATEASAATLPIGAVVGPAGFPTLPYDLTFKGSFFDVANFMSGVDSLVQVREGVGQVSANGRLLTVDGFSLSSPTLAPVPELKVNFSVTSYVVPAEQGLTAGATPGAPAPAPTQPPTTPTSAPVSP